MDIASDDNEVELSQRQTRELAVGFVQALVACSQWPHSAYLKYFVKLLFDTNCSHETIQKVSEITDRSESYLYDIKSRGTASRNIFGMPYPVGTARPHRAVDSTIQKFLILHSRAKSNYRVLDSHVGIDLRASFNEFEHDESQSVSGKVAAISKEKIDKIRKHLHIRKCPHDFFDLFSCEKCRPGFVEAKLRELEVLPKDSIPYRQLKAEINGIEIHHHISKSQQKAYHQLLKNLKGTEAIAIADFGKVVTAADRCPLFVIVVVTVDFNELTQSKKYVYDHFLYGSKSQMFKNWDGAQICLQDFFRTVAATRYSKIDFFHDSYYGDFRNVNMLLFYGIMSEVYGIELVAHYFGAKHGKFLCDGFIGTGKRMIRCDLQFMKGDDIFDRFFAYKTFARIKRTSVKLLEDGIDDNLEDYVYQANKTSKIGKLGISRYYAFAFPSRGRVRAAVTSEHLENGVFDEFDVSPAL
jgi:hypothetical protein